MVGPFSDLKPPGIPEPKVPPVECAKVAGMRAWAAPPTHWNVDLTRLFGGRGLIRKTLVTSLSRSLSLSKRAVLHPISHFLGQNSILVLFSLFIFGLGPKNTTNSKKKNSQCPEICLRFEFLLEAAFR